MQRRRRAGKTTSHEVKELMLIYSMFKQIAEKHYFQSSEELMKFLCTHDVNGNPIGTQIEEQTSVQSLD